MAGKVLSSISMAGNGQLIKMLINLESHGILRSKFACLLLIQFNIVQNGDNDLPSLILAG